MDKVLVTTPRIGSSIKNGEVRRNRRKEREGSYDDLPRYSSMKPKSRKWDDRKYLNEYLNPLIRFLQKNCNRPWNKVYSEICTNMDRRSAVKAHIFEHLFDYVERTPVFKSGKPYTTGYGGLTPIYRTGWSFYVDERGLLKEPKDKRPPWRTDKDNPYAIKIDEKTFLLRREEDKVWFKASLISISEETDPYLLCFHGNPEWATNLLASIGEHCRSKRINLKTLSKKEKRRLKLP